jgi:hypothetical protein
MAGKVSFRLMVIRSLLAVVLGAVATAILLRLFPQLGVWAQVICVGSSLSFVVPMWVEYTNRPRDGGNRWGLKAGMSWCFWRY